MPPGRRLPFPVAPDLPARLEPAPAVLGSQDVWEQVEAGADTEVADLVADAHLRESVWTDAQLVGRRFSGLDCSDVRFVRADLAGVMFEDCRFTRVVFDACRMSGTVLAGSALHEVELVECVAARADFRMATVRRTMARETTLQGADFYACGLTDVRFDGCDLTGANFDTARTERLDLRGSTLEGLRGVGCLAGSTIEADQVLPLGAAMIGSLGFRIE